MRFIETICSVYRQFHGQARLDQLNKSLEDNIVPIYHLHASILMELGNFKDALTHLQTARSLYEGTPTAPQSHRDSDQLYLICGGLGDAFSGLGQHKKAEECYEQCLSLQPSSIKFSIYELNMCRAVYSQRPDRSREAIFRLKRYLRRWETRSALNDKNEHEYL